MKSFKELLDEASAIEEDDFEEGLFGKSAAQKTADRIKAQRTKTNKAIAPGQNLRKKSVANKSAEIEKRKRERARNITRGIAKRATANRARI